MAPVERWRHDPRFTLAQMILALTDGATCWHGARDNEGAAATYKRGYAHHRSLAMIAETDEVLSGILRPGNAGTTPPSITSACLTMRSATTCRLGAAHRMRRPDPLTTPKTTWYRMLHVATLITPNNRRLRLDRDRPWTRLVIDAAYRVRTAFRILAATGQARDAVDDRYSASPPASHLRRVRASIW